MSRGTCNTRAWATIFPKGLEIIILSCRLPIGPIGPHTSHTYWILLRTALQYLHFLSTQEACISFTPVKAATILSKACGKACNGVKFFVWIKFRIPLPPARPKPSAVTSSASVYLFYHHSSCCRHRITEHKAAPNPPWAFSLGHFSFRSLL